MIITVLAINFSFFSKKVCKKFGGVVKRYYFCSPIWRERFPSRGFLRDWVKIFARGCSRRDTKESVRRYSERRQRSLTYCNKRKVQCEVYISYLRRYKIIPCSKQQKNFFRREFTTKSKNNFRSQNKSLFASACIILYVSN